MVPEVAGIVRLAGRYRYGEQMIETRKAFGRTAVVWITAGALILGVAAGGGVVWGIKQAELEELGSAIHEVKDSLDGLTVAVAESVEAITACQTTLDVYVENFSNISDANVKQSDALKVFFNRFDVYAGEPTPLFAAFASAATTRRDALRAVLDVSDEELTCAVYR